MAKIKDKDRVLKAARERKKVGYKGKPIRLSSNFSAEALQARREWHDIFNAMKEKGLEPRILYPARLSFKYEGGIKQFPEQQKLREFASHKPPTSTGYFRGTALDGSTLKKSTEQNIRHMKKGGGGIRRERRKEAPDSVHNRSISELS